MSEFSISITLKHKNEHSFNLWFFIFFLPYLLRILSSFSPLFITTTLLLLSLFSLSPLTFDASGILVSKLGFFLSTFYSLVEKFSSRNEKNDEGAGHSKGFQAYLDVFQALSLMFLRKIVQIQNLDVQVMKQENHQEIMWVHRKKEPNVNLDAAGLIAKEKYLKNDRKLEDVFCEKDERKEVLEENYAKCWLDHVGLMEENAIGEDDKVKIAEGKKSLENKTKLEDMFCQKGEKEVKEPNKAGESKEKMALRSGSKVEGNNYSRIDAEERTVTNSEEYFGTPQRNFDYIGRYGSMRKERDWRRTLAFKLYEERYNVGGSEGMDLLWQTFNDTETNDKVQGKGSRNTDDNDDD